MPCLDISSFLCVDGPSLTSHPAGGFGSNTTGAFGSAPKPAFGAATTASTGGGLFGSNTNTTTSGSSFGGGFGSNTNTATPSAFGGGSAGGGLFSNTASKPAFGSTGGNTLFGSGTSSNTGTFGSGSAFSAPASTALGGPVGDAPGTATTAFTPTVEKESPTSLAQNSFQSVLFQEPYKKWSGEELRLADYAQNRRFGSGTGPGFGGGFGSAGFGANTNTATAGGFGSNNTGGGLFGSNTTTAAPSGFGSNTASSGFGSNATSGGLFGAKPAATSGGLFGSTPASSTPATGGMFGGASGSNAFGGNTTGGFGSNTNTAATGGGLFGSNNQQQNKPANSFSFGTSNAAASNTGGGGLFGSNNAQPSTGFGNNTTAGGGLFGNQQQTSTTTSGGLFGGGNNTQQNTAGFGSGTGFGAQSNNQAAGGLFGNQNQQKPGGLFGSANTGATGGGLLGLSTTNNTNSAFGNNTQQQGGLFGNKPAGAAGGGLFGNNTATQNTNVGGGLFGALGSNQQQQNQSGGLFGGGMNNSTQNKPNGLFGASTQATTGGGLFGTPNNTQGGLFGNSTNQQQQNSGLGNSLFGSTMNNQAQTQTLTASVNDPSAYGTGSVFGNLSAPTNDPGPLATPLSSKKQARRPSILPMYKLNPASASRFITPQKRGFGFSYSTYGTPNSPSSVSSTPGAMTQSLLNGGSLSRSLAKSISTSNLRRSFNVEDTLLAPGAFSASVGPRHMGGSNVKKLVINRELRSDLFSTPTKDKLSDDTPDGSRKVAKRVSFEATETPKAIEAPLNSPGNTPSAEDLGYIRPARTNGVNGSKDGSSPLEAEHVKGKELAIVHEEEIATPVAKASPAAGANTDKELGDYWMEPSKEEIQNMNRVQRQKVQNFTVGRQNSGWVKFKVPVDLTNIDLDNLYDNIVVLEIRSCTVYPNPAKKPAVGKGLNVPSLINLENSWPRAAKTRGKANTSLAKHIERLKRIEGTTFENYNKETGEWTFSVEHFTTYGLDYDEEEETEAEPSMEPIISRGPRHDSESLSPPTHPDFDQDDDAYDSRHGRRSLPGAFDDDGTYEDEELVEEMAQVNGPRSFLASRSAGSTSKTLVPVAQDDLDDEYGSSQEEDASAFPGHHQAAEPDEDSFAASQMELVTETPAGIMRARMRAIKGSATPAKVTVTAGDDWMDMLQKTISPQKRDRALLKSIHEAEAYRPKDSVQLQLPAKKRVVSDARGFATSIDLMKSIFDQAKAPVEKPQPAVRPANVKVGCF